MNLKSKVAIVTGASSGIGAQFSKDLIQRGATVYGLARSTDKLNAIKKELGEQFIPVTADITNSAKLEEWVNETFSADHYPDILINNAGLGYFAKVDDLKLDEWDRMLNVNLSGVFYLTRLIVPLMKENEQVCHIINISSIAGLMGNPEISAYNATKYGLRGFSDALFKELRYDGIKVSCFFPGSIATNFFDSMEDVDQHPNMMHPKDVSNTLIHVLETPDNFLINELIMRPLDPKAPAK
jgi:NADP-dependent 3-hydroxy acid dehydrogenase YdfG